MMRFVAIILFLAVLVATWAPHRVRHGADNAALAEDSAISADAAMPPAAAAPAFATSRELVIYRSPDSHFYTDAQVGPATIHFLIDTGATTIALSPADAQAAGVQYAASDRTGTARTAGGEVGLKRVTLDRVVVGPFETRDVDAAVIDTPMAVSLLGQSWLRHVGAVTISGDRMVLR